MSNEINNGGKGFNIVVLDKHKNLVKIAHYDTNQRGTL